MKLLISDLDGTLYPQSKEENMEQLQRNINAVKKWIEKGNEFAVATARGAHHYSELKKELGFEVNYIGANGAEVILKSGEEIIKSIPASIFIDLCTFVEGNEIDASVATGINDMWVWSSKKCYPIKDSLIIQPSWEYITVLDKNSINPTSEINRIQIFTHPNSRDELKQIIIDLNYPITVTTSDVDMIDIGPPNSSKGISIMNLCNRYQINTDDLIVIGDSENDIPMFELTKNSYCISHADLSVSVKASRTVDTVEEAIYREL